MLKKCSRFTADPSGFMAHMTTALRQCENGTRCHPHVVGKRRPLDGRKNKGGQTTRGHADMFFEYRLNALEKKIQVTKKKNFVGFFKKK